MLALVELATNNRMINYVYTTKLWNYMRRTHRGTDMCVFNIDRGDDIISIDGTCDFTDSPLVCKHLVKYRYNGMIQSEYFQNHVILKLCRQLGIPVDKHFTAATVDRIKKI